MFSVQLYPRHVALPFLADDALQDLDGHSEPHLFFNYPICWDYNHNQDRQIAEKRHIPGQSMNNS